jgi:hypothetical protein
MTTPTLYRVKDAATGDLLLIAPITTIAKMFRLHKDAVRRVTSELDFGQAAYSSLHFNGRGPDWAPAAVLITL